MCIRSYRRSQNYVILFRFLSTVNPKEFGMLLAAFLLLFNINKGSYNQNIDREPTVNLNKVTQECMKNYLCPKAKADKMTRDVEGKKREIYVTA